ncbi:light harvesting complex protein, partial [Nannochloropsis oceanica]
MKFLAALTGILATATAFVPSAPLPSGRRSSALRMSASDMIGIDVETGGLFDPLGFSKDEQSLYRYRAVELKHGRVAMLACLGTLVQSYTHLPDDVFSNPRPLAALAQISTQRPLAVLQIVLALVFIEVTSGKQDPELAPGQIGRFGEAFKPEGEEEMAAVQLKELKNGRLAMIAIIGQWVQELLTGQGPIEQITAGHISPFGDGQGLF